MKSKEIIPKKSDKIHKVGGLCETTLEFRETTDGGISWSAPKLTKTFDPPSVGTRTQYEDDRTVYVAEDPGITRVGVMFSKEYLEAEMDKLDISQNIDAHDNFYYDKGDYMRNLDLVDSETSTLKLISRADIARAFHRNSLDNFSGKRASQRESYTQSHWISDPQGFEINVSRTNCDFEGEPWSVLIPRSKKSACFLQPPEPSGAAQSSVPSGSCQ